MSFAEVVRSLWHALKTMNLSGSVGGLSASLVRGSGQQWADTRWEAVAPADRTYLIAAAHLAADSPTIATADVARVLGKPSTTSLSPNRDRLINDHHLLAPAGHGHLRFAVPGFDAWL